MNAPESRPGPLARLWSRLRSRFVPRRRLGFTREVQVLLSAGLFLLLVLSTLTLFSYRNAIQLLIEERRVQAARTARRVAERISAGAPATADNLPRLAPEARGVILAAADGTRVAAGGLGSSKPLAPLPIDDRPEGALALGPGPELPGVVAGFAPLLVGGERHYVRVDLPAETLAAQQRTLPVLTAVVLGINAALALLLAAFLRHLLNPYRTLLERARRLGEPSDPRGDETAFLLSTFERAVEALERTAAAPVSTSPMEDARDVSRDEDIAALERTLTASLDSGLLLLNRTGEVLAVNPPGAEALSIASPPPGTPVEEVLAERPELLAVLRRAIDTRRGVRRRELSLDTPEGEITLGFSVHPLRREDTTVRGFLVLFTDLTEAQREEAESRLAESLARLGEMAAGVAHELRNSLATLRGYLGLLERRSESESMTPDLIEMRRETDHLQRVVDDFLAFARPGTARIEATRLATVVERAAADPVLDGVRVEIDGGDADEAVIRGDPQLLERAVRNLLHNAAEAERRADRSEGERSDTDRSDAREPPRVRVGLLRHESEVEVRIEDRGPGLPEEVRRRMFQPFTSGRQGGVGLGLALSHRIASLHGGRLRIEDRDGGGTRARLLLPIPDGRNVTGSSKSR